MSDVFESEDFRMGSSDEPARYERTPSEDRAARAFLAEYFAEREPGEDPSAGGPSAAEEETVRALVAYVDERFDRMKYILGLALDFVFLAQRVSGGNDFDPDLTRENLFERYERVERSRGRKLNTLTLRDGAGGEVGIRQTEERVLEFFHGVRRTDYPSAYVYNTGQWHKYPGLLALAFRLSEAGRLAAAAALVDYGLARMRPNAAFSGDARPRLFPAVVAEYPRAAVEGENAGALFQGIAYGYFKADRPHLSLVVDKVRTGSSRQRRLGDIDGYRGLDVEFSAEVKDLHLTNGNRERELGSFVELVRRDGILGIAFAHEIDADVREELAEAGVRALSQEDLLREVARWDWYKQDAALLGLLHYLAHVEQNPGAAQRLLAFLGQRDPEHDAVRRHLDPDTELPPEADASEEGAAADGDVGGATPENPEPPAGGQGSLGLG